MIKNVKERVWAFDLEWIPDPLAGRLLHGIPDSVESPREIMQAMWRAGGASDDELGFADEFSDAGADHVHADRRAVLLADDLDHAGGADDFALAVAGQVVVVALNLVGSVRVDRLCLGQAD